MHIFSACVSPTSTTKRFFTIGWTTVQRASRMLMPVSAKQRDRSSSSRVRSQPSISISTRKELLEPSESHATFVKRSGFFISAFAFAQLS